MITFTNILVGLITTILLLLIYLKRSLNYWKNRNVPSLPARMLLGNLENPMISETSKDMQFWNFYKEFKKIGAKHGGVYMLTSPVYLPIDLDIVKRVLSQDFKYFNDRGFYINKNVPLTMNLFGLGGERWKSLRKKLSPTFSSGKVKMMFETILDCTDPLKNEVMKYKGDKANFKNVFLKFSTNVIGSCAYGMNCNAFDGAESEYVKKALSLMEHVPFIHAIKHLMCMLFPNFSRFLNFSPMPEATVNFYTKMIHDLVNYRIENNVSRNDYMQILIELLKSNSEAQDGDDTFGLDSITAQAFLFFFAGFESSSSTASFCLYELAKNPEIQERVRKEIEEVLSMNNGKCTYESLGEMKYLTQAIEETLRLYPIAALLTRQCMETYKMPDSDLTIEEGTIVGISVFGIHRDEEYYPNPEKFDPDRFSEENKALRNPFTFLAFGEGPKMCMGVRFGMMQVKIGLITLLRDFKFTLNKKTLDPIEFENNIFLTAKGGIWLDVLEIKQ